jgi:hypothetical protein
MILHIGVTKSFQEPSLSNTRIVPGHPCLVVAEIAAQHGGDLIFTYSRYEVAPPRLQAAAPRSDVIRVAACDISPDWLADRFAELRPNEEMAWHSWVERRGVGFHIPMIDFISRPTHSVLHELVRTLTKDMCLSGHFDFFETGRSFHGYFSDLIPERTWPMYLGRLLVLDKHDSRTVIDTRWVGHALARGFAALRWSHNTNRYRAMPHLVSVPDRVALSQSRHR